MHRGPHRRTCSFCRVNVSEGTRASTYDGPPPTRPAGLGYVFNSALVGRIHNWGVRGKWESGKAALNRTAL